MAGKALQKDFAFGRPSNGKDGAVAADGLATKACIFPIPPPAEEAKKEAELYSKSHGSYPPGVRKNCPIVWESTGIDPNAYAFGKKTGRMPSGAILSSEKNKPISVTKGTADSADALLNPAHDTSVATSRVVPKSVDDFRVTAGDRIGQVRGAGAKDFSAHPPVYGRPSKSKKDAGDWTTADCIRGDYTAEEQQPDTDLGRSVRAIKRPGVAVTAASVPDPSRRFGVPSIRLDVPARHNQSVANTTDFGDGASAAMLLSPSPYAEHGVDDADFVVPRGRGELRDIFERIGHSFSDADFDALHRHVSRKLFAELRSSTFFM
jgi:hypothetical protein